MRVYDCPSHHRPRTRLALKQRDSRLRRRHSGRSAEVGNGVARLDVSCGSKEHSNRCPAHSVPHTFFSWMALSSRSSEPSGSLGRLAGKPNMPMNQTTQQFAPNRLPRERPRSRVSKSKMQIVTRSSRLHEGLFCRRMLCNRG